MKTDIDNLFNIFRLLLFRLNMRRVLVFLLAVLIAMNVKTEIFAPFTTSYINPFDQLVGLPMLIQQNWYLIRLWFDRFKWTSPTILQRTPMALIS